MKIGMEVKSVKLTREEMLVCIIALERRKNMRGWEKSALKKLLKAMGRSE